MQPTAILYPSIAMFFLTSSVLGYLAMSRLRAIRAGEMRLPFYQLYNLGEEPARLRQITRHAQNHFEVPPLFHVVVILLYATRNVSTATVALAWLYFASRCVHSYIHLGSNDVNLRFAAFASGLLVLVVLWLVLLVSLIASSG